MSLPRLGLICRLGLRVDCFCPLLPKRTAVQDEWWQGNAPCQLLHVTGKLHGLELCDLGKLLCLGRRDDGNPLGNLESPLQLLCAFGAEKLIDSSFCLFEVTADHADPRHIKDHGDGEGHQADDDKVQAQAALTVSYTQSDGVVFGPRGDTGVASTVFERDRSDVQDAILLNQPLPTWSHNTKDNKTKTVSLKALEIRLENWGKREETFSLIADLKSVLSSSSL